MTIKLIYKVYEIMDIDNIRIDYKTKTRDAVNELIFSKRDEILLEDEKKIL